MEPETTNSNGVRPKNLKSRELQNTIMNEKKFSEQVVSALVHFLYNFIIYFIFIVPFDLWKKATIRLANQKEKGGLEISKINSPWPFMSFLKVFILDFLIDGFIFILYILGLVVAVFLGIQSGDFMTFLGTISAIYFAPVGLSLLRDTLQLMILPFKKFLSWASKPAQYMDLQVYNKSSILFQDSKEKMSESQN